MISERIAYVIGIMEQGTRESNFILNSFKIFDALIVEIRNDSLGVIRGCGSAGNFGPIFMRPAFQN
jgi:hypothetical protein